MTRKEEFETMVKDHAGEIVIDGGFHLVMLLRGIEEDESDYYWRFLTLDRGIVFSSCVGRWDALKGKVDNNVHEYYKNIFKRNYKCWTEPKYILEVAAHFGEQEVKDALEFLAANYPEVDNEKQWDST